MPQKKRKKKEKKYISKMEGTRNALGREKAKSYPAGLLCSLCVIKRQSSSLIHEVYIIAAVVELVLAVDPHENVCAVCRPALLTNTAAPVM